MLKKFLITVCVFAILLMLALTYVTARFVDQEEILRVKTEAEEMRNMRDSLLTEVAFRDSVERIMETEIEDLRTNADSLRSQVDSIETARQEEQLKVRRLRRPEDLKAEFAATFPEIPESTWGIEKVYNQEEDVSLLYFFIPLHFMETSILSYKNMISYERQKNTLLLVDSLRVLVSELQDSVIVLERQNRHAFQTGFHTTFEKYEARNWDYINLLKKPPQITLGLPKWGWLALTAAGGAAVGYGISR